MTSFFISKPIGRTVQKALVICSRKRHVRKPLRGRFASLFMTCCRTCRHRLCTSLSKRRSLHACAENGLGGISCPSATRWQNRDLNSRTVDLSRILLEVTKWSRVVKLVFLFQIRVDHCTRAKDSIQTSGKYCGLQMSARALLADVFGDVYDSRS